MNPLKNIYYKGVRLLNLSLLRKLYRGRILLPYHHLVSNESVPHIKHLYPYKNVREFETDLDYLLKHFKPVTLQQVLDSIRAGQPLPADSFLLTFDDGLREVKEIIAPILQRKGLPAVFFLNTDFLDNKSLYYHFKISLMIEALQSGSPSKAQLCEASRILQLRPDTPVAEISDAMHRIKYRERGLTDQLGEVLSVDFEGYLRERRPFMTSGEVQLLVDQGFSVGGHSIDHPYYTELSFEEQLRQTTTSVNYLVEKFKLPYKVFAFPHFDTGISKAFFNTLLNGPHPALDLIFGTANHKKDVLPQVLHRFNCERPAVHIEEAVKGIMVYNVGHEWLGRNEVTRG